MPKVQVMCKNAELDEADLSMCKYTFLKQLTPATKLLPATYEQRPFVVVMDKSGSYTPGDALTCHLEFTKAEK